MVVASATGRGMTGVAAVATTVDTVSVDSVRNDSTA